MTFSQGRAMMGRQLDKNNWELIRSCSKLNHNIVGGASKLLSYFIKQYKPQLIYSYADLRWTSDVENVYTKLGFVSKNLNYEPHYWYTIDYKTRLHRSNFTKQNLIKKGADSSKTEFEIMDELGYSRIWDCGTLRYELSF